MDAPTTTLTLRLPEALKARMERLAQATARSQSFLAVEALAAFVADNEWQIEAVREGLADADAGRFVAHEQVVAALAGWGQRPSISRGSPAQAAAADGTEKRSARRAPTVRRSRTR